MYFISLKIFYGILPNFHNIRHGSYAGRCEREFTDKYLSLLETDKSFIFCLDWNAASG